MTRMPDPNAPECDCRYLDRLSKEPSAPIEFDAKLNEYHIAGANGGYFMIYHCPFCGGRMPQSRRDELFMHISDAEKQRLNDLTRTLTTVADVINAFGTPDLDNPTGFSVTKDNDTGMSNTSHYRTLTYNGLSATARVVATVGLNDQVHFRFTPKGITGA